MEPQPEIAASQGTAGNAVRIGTAESVGAWDKRESAMGLGKKAKHKVKKVKGHAKKDVGKVKHKGKKAKNAAKH